MTTTTTLQIKFLDGHAPIDVCERPRVLLCRAGEHGLKQDVYGSDLAIGWGDRESDLNSGERDVPRTIRMLPPRVYRRSTGPAVSAEEIARVQAIVNRVWSETPTVPAACEKYRLGLQGIHDAGLRHVAQWELDARAIAKAFRRARVEVGEQTVPGKCCVRSSRGKLLGYADVWDGRWLGTIERI